MYRVLLLTIFLLFSCSSVTEDDPIEIIEVDYGEYMFPMSCVWDDGIPDGINESGTVVFCYKHNVRSEIIDADFFVVSLEYPEHADERVRICGENLNLYSGHSLYDSLLPALTNDTYGCVNAFDRIKNDEFDWFWHDEERVLEFLWSPEENPPLNMYLIIEPPEFGTSLYVEGYASTGAIYLKKDP